MYLYISIYLYILFRKPIQRGHFRAKVMQRHFRCKVNKGYPKVNLSQDCWLDRISEVGGWYRHQSIAGATNLEIHPKLEW